MHSGWQKEDKNLRVGYLNDKDRNRHFSQGWILGGILFSDKQNRFVSTYGF